MTRIRIAVVTVTALFCLALPAPANAIFVSANTDLNVGSFPAPTITNGDSDFVSSSLPGAIVDATASTNTGFETTATQWNGSAFARASGNTLGVSTSLTLTGFNADVIGQINQTAIARYQNFFTFDPGSLDTFYLSPIFDLTGMLSATPGVPAQVLMNMEFFSTSAGNHVDTLFAATAPGDGSTLTIDERITPVAYSAVSTDVITVRVALSVNIMNFQLTGLAPGDYAANIDFAGTSIFRGFSVFEDAAMTVAVTSGVTITTEDGESISVVDPSGSTPDPTPTPVPEPATLLLFVFGLAGLSFAMRKRRIRYAF